MACFKQCHQYYQNIDKKWEEMFFTAESTSPCFDSSSEEEEKQNPSTFKVDLPPDPEVKKALEDEIEKIFHKNNHFFAHKAELTKEYIDKKLPECNANGEYLDNYIEYLEMESLRNTVYNSLNQPIVTSRVEPVDINELEDRLQEEQEENNMPQKEINKLKTEIEMLTCKACKNVMNQYVN